MKNIIQTLLILCFLSGCDSNHSGHVDAYTELSFTEDKELTGEILDFEELKNPHRMLLRDSILIISNKNTDRLISVFNVTQQKSIGEFLHSGKGPHELTAVSSMSLNENSDLLLVNDHLMNKVFVYDLKHLDEIPFQPSLVIAPETKLENIQFLSEDILVGRPGFGEKADARVTLLNKEGKTHKSFGSFPESQIEIPEMALNRAYEFIPVGKSGDDSLVALFNKITDLIELYDTDGNLLKRMHGPDQFHPIIEMKNRNNAFVPAFVNGETRQAFQNPIERGGKLWVKYSGDAIDNYDTFFYILVFDWELNPIARYKLSENILSFDVDIAKRIIYVLATNDGEPMVKTYSY